MIAYKRKRKRNQNHPKTERTYKDRLFRFVFQNKEDLLELYNALNHSEYKNPQELIVNTLEDVIYMGMKNDISFLIGGTLNLYEYQSTRNPNMPLRGLFYFARIYENYAGSNRKDIYSSTLQRLPFPRYLIFYNGVIEEPDRKELSLSSAFEGGCEDEKPCLECIATFVNINYGHNRELMENCRKLKEYSLFVNKVRENLNAGTSKEQAVSQAVDECIELGILREILMKNRNEVMDMVLTSFDQELHDKQEREAAYNEGREEERKTGIRVLITALRGAQAGREETARTVRDNYGLTEEETEKYMGEFWKE